MRNVGKAGKETLFDLFALFSIRRLEALWVMTWPIKRQDSARDDAGNAKQTLRAWTMRRTGSEHGRGSGLREIGTAAFQLEAAVHPGSHLCSGNPSSVI